MPVFNEAASVGGVVSAVLQQSCVAELIVVDDHSTDGSWSILEEAAREEPRLQLFRHEQNLGKGAALRTGIAKASAPIVLIQDADFEYDPIEYDRLIQPIVTDSADVVFGSRFRGGGAHRVFHFWNYLGNQLLTKLSNLVTNLNLTDMEACYKAFRREIIQSLEIEEHRFGFEPEITAKVAQLGVRIYEVPISYHGRTYAEGKKVGWRDGISAVRCIVKYNVRRKNGSHPRTESTNSASAISRINAGPR
ncbi:MAG: hypothetical protein QOD99_37 [Chthoniobacter sp.]|nr:hypothetical protein [Chthoniobacter sp.]